MGKAYALPPSLIKQLKSNKDKIIEDFQNDELAKKLGFIVGISGLIYECSLNRFCSVYIEQLNGKWFTWCESYQKRRSEAIYMKAIESGNEFKYVLLRASKYIKFVQSKTIFD